MFQSVRNVAKKLRKTQTQTQTLLHFFPNNNSHHYSQTHYIHKPLLSSFLPPQTHPHKLSPFPSKPTFYQSTNFDPSDPTHPPISGVVDLLRKSHVFTGNSGSGGGGGVNGGGGCVVDIPGLKKRGQQGIHSWIKVNSAGMSEIVEVDKFSMMRKYDLPARDLRLLDPLFVYPSTILGREKAIVVNLEQIRCIITSDEVYLENSLDGYVEEYVEELKRRLDVEGAAMGRFGMNGAGMLRGSCVDDLPFEFRAFEVALESACTLLAAEASELETEAYPLLDELTSMISTLTLESVRLLKSRLVALTRRVQKVRNEIEQLMDDDGDMAEMYLTEKKRWTELSFYGDQSILGRTSSGGGMSVSAPVGSPTDGEKLEKSYSNSRNRHDSTAGSYSDENVVELEMLLEAYFVVIDSTLNKLTSLKEYMDNTEDFINIQLDNVRNQLIQFELLLTTATFIVAICGVVAGVFGMNFSVPFYNDPNAFKSVLTVTGSCGVVIFCAFLFLFKYRRLILL